MFELKKIKPYRNQKHIDWVRSKSCVACGHPSPSDAHHLIATGNGGMGTKDTDAMTIPLCRICHTLLHIDPTEFDQTHYFLKFIRAAFNNGEMVCVGGR